MRSAIFAFAFLGLASACTSSISGTAQLRFKEDFVCPDDRIHLATRPDLKLAPLPASTETEPSARPPPPGVDADPDRARLWRQMEDARLADIERAHAKAKADSTDARQAVEVFELEGCGQRAFYGCSLHTYSGRLGQKTTVNCAQMVSSAPGTVERKPDDH